MSTMNRELESRLDSFEDLPQLLSLVMHALHSSEISRVELNELERLSASLRIAIQAKRASLAN